MGYTGAIDIGI